MPDETGRDSTLSHNQSGVASLPTALEVTRVEINPEQQSLDIATLDESVGKAKGKSQAENNHAYEDVVAVRSERGDGGQQAITRSIDILTNINDDSVTLDNRITSF